MEKSIQTIAKRLPLMAAILGAGLAMANTSHSNATYKGYDDPVYFSFNGTPGQENITALWQEVSASDYSDLSCPGSKNGCGIVQNGATTTGTAPNRHPSSVPVTGTASNMTPIVDNTYTVDAQFKNE